LGKAASADSGNVRAAPKAAEEIDLSQEQNRVVNHGDGPMLVVAGPGSGKTRVLSERYVRLVRDGLAKSGQILILAYNREAVSEMSRRVVSRLGPGDHSIQTFHAFGLRLLREHGWLAGLPTQFRVVSDPAQQWLLLEQVLREQQPSYFYPAQPRRDLKPLQNLISRAKQENVMPERLITWAQQRSNGSGDLDDQLAQLLRQGGEAFQAYQARLAEKGLVEFEDMIQMLAQALETSQSLRDVVTKTYRFVMVDEFQDANFVQSLLLERLSVAPHNILVVADDDQSIYKFRGASLSNIERFKRTFPNTITATLGRNYRSTLEIVGVTSCLIELYDRRQPKDLHPSRDHGALVRVVSAPDLLSEAAWVANECRRSVDAGAEQDSIAILARTNWELVPFGQALAQVELRVDQSGGGNLFSRPEVKDLLALIRAAADPTDDQALLRLLRHPRYELQNASRLAVSTWFRASGKPLFNAPPAELQTLSGTDLGNLSHLKSDVAFLADMAQREDARSVVYAALERSEYVGVTDSEDPKEGIRAAANVRRFAELVSAYQLDKPEARVHDLLDYIRLAAETDVREGESPREIGLPAVRLATVHSSKGLEFDHVFVVNLSDGMFPGRAVERQLDLPPELVEGGEGGPGEPIDEERRLFYVAMSRAKETLTLCRADRYREWEKSERAESQFLAELRERVPHLLEEGRAPQVTLPPVRAVTRLISAADQSISYTVSELLNFSDCPLRYAYQNEYQLPQRPSRELVLGSLVHAALEQAGRRRVAAAQVSQADLLEFLDRAWLHASFDKVAWADLKGEASKALIRYVGSDHWAEAQIVEVERQFEVEAGGVRFKGRIDRIDKVEERYRIIDYKSGRAKTEAEAKKETRLRRQFGLYRAAAEILLETDRIDLEAHFITAGAVTPVTQSQDLKWAYAVSKEIAESREARSFPAKPSDFNCPSCPFRLVCDEGQEYLRRRRSERSKR
jgi:DNA helicase-2/ATP-dependent DNA helicase PcrA